MMFMGFKDIAEVQSRKYVGKKVKIHGWVYRHRSGKNNVFIIVYDSSGTIQCVLDSDSPYFMDAKKTTVESSVEISGTLRRDKRAPTGYEISIEKFKVVGLAERFPITKDKSEEFLLDVRHLWVRSSKMRNIWKIRSTVFSAIREYLDKNGYYETHSPVLTKTSESGLELFEVGYYGKKLRLAQTWQFYSEAMLPALEKIYTITPSFRAEKLKTARHLSEYWHAEVEVAWVDLDGLIKIAEGLVSHICQKVAKERTEELKALGRDPKKLEKIKPPFPSITYDEALKILKKDRMNVRWGKDLRTLEEKKLMKHYKKPLIVTHYPKEVMAFYKPKDPKNPKVALCFDMIAPEAGFELMGGSERDLDIEEMKKILRKRGEKLKDYEWYFDTRRYGAFPHSGFGMGVERIIQWICGLISFKDGLPFPRTVVRYLP